eukprot:15480471-Alexandrium_andersonii.AAC.1
METEKNKGNGGARRLRKMPLGYGIIDCGATGTVGGLDTLEALAKRNAEKHGDTRMKLDASDRPTYTFADGKSRRALGVAEFTVEAGGKPG